MPTATNFQLIEDGRIVAALEALFAQEIPPPHRPDSEAALAAHVRRQLEKREVERRRYETIRRRDHQRRKVAKPE